MVHYFYDKEADVFYFSQGAAGARDETIEAGGDVLLHVSQRTKKIRGFTLLNVSKRSKKTGPVMLPFSLVAA